MTRFQVAVSVLVYMAIVFGMVLIAAAFVTVVNTFREVRYLRYVNRCQKKKLVDLGIERNSLADENDELRRSIHNQQPFGFWVRTCELDDMRAEIRRLTIINENLEREINNRKERKTK